MQVTLPLKKLLTLFDLKDPDDWELFEERYPIDLSDYDFLTISEEDGALVDFNDVRIPDDAISEIENLILDAQDYANSRKKSEFVKDSLEEILNKFSSYSYNYSVLTDSGLYRNLVGVARGIEKIQVDFADNTVTLDLDKDFVHIIENCISGYGMFEVEDEEMDEDSAKEYIESNFSWIQYHFDIYNESLPNTEICLDGDFRNSDVDWSHLGSIEKYYGIKVCSDFYKRFIPKEEREEQNV